MFPAAGLGWVISKEDFFSNVNNIQYLKLKASYGKSGNDKAQGINDRLAKIDDELMGLFERWEVLEAKIA